MSARKKRITCTPSSTLISTSWVISFPRSSLSTYPTTPTDPPPPCPRALPTLDVPPSSPRACGEGLGVGVKSQGYRPCGFTPPGSPRKSAPSHPPRQGEGGHHPASASAGAKRGVGAGNDRLLQARRGGGEVLGKEAGERDRLRLAVGGAIARPRRARPWRDRCRRRQGRTGADRVRRRPVRASGSLRSAPPIQRVASASAATASPSRSPMRPNSGRLEARTSSAVCVSSRDVGRRPPCRLPAAACA